MVKFDDTGEKLICHFSGHLDSANVAKWESWLTEKIEETDKKVVFDLENVPYVSSGFLRICIQVSKKIGQKNLSIIHTCDYVHKVMTVSGLDKQFKIK